MKRLFIVFVSLIFVSLFAFAKDVKILTIGNSFSVGVFTYLPKIVDDFPDCTLTLESANHANCSFDIHWRFITEEESDATISRYNKNTITQSYCSTTSTVQSQSRGCNRLTEILKSKDWDFITIQQVSNKSLFKETFYPYAENVYKYVKKRVPNAEIIVHQTWSYRCDHPNFLPTGTWGKEGIGQTEMFKRAEANYAELAKKFNLRVLPTGKAVQNYRAVEENPFKPYSKEYLSTFRQPDVPSDKGDIVGKYSWGENSETKEMELKGDYIHLNARGEYMQSCLWFGFFFDKDPLEIKYVPNVISADEAKLLREVASKTLKEFKQPRDSK